MKRIFITVCLVCICGVSACGSFSGSNGQTDTLTAEEAPVIDATINPYDRCGVNGISCNDTALVNYTKRKLTTELTASVPKETIFTPSRLRAII